MTLKRYIFVVTEKQGRWGIDIPDASYSRPCESKTLADALADARNFLLALGELAQRNLLEIKNDPEIALKLNHGSILVLDTRPVAPILSGGPTELLEAAKELLPYLEASTDHRDMLMSIRTASTKENEKALKEIQKRDEVSPADRLRQQADEMEAKDEIVKRFRAAVAALAE